jgi:hypothetical protein
MEDCQNLIMKAKQRSPSPEELAKQLASQGAPGAAREAMAQGQAPGPVGQQSAIASGALPLGDMIQQGVQQVGQAIIGPAQEQIKEQVQETVREQVKR